MKEQDREYDIEQEKEVTASKLVTEENIAIMQKMVEPLLVWFDSHARVLPWREEPTPYRVWISEIMLQQTRVEAVKPYFERFLHQLPDIESLAKVPEEELLKLWEGLGYYNRARNLQKAARQVIEEHEGEIPEEKEALMKLAGIGSYTAGAISSIAYGRSNPAVDGNVLRIVARLLGSKEDVLDPKVKQQFEQLVERVIPTDRPGAYNQAMMELGATVCIPNGEPKCEECPWGTACMARAQGWVDCIPYKTSKKPRKIEKMTVFIIRSESTFAIRKRPSTGLLAGMYEFPWVSGHLEVDEAVHVLHKMGVSPLHIERLADATHIFTHKEWHMVGYDVRVDELEPMGHDPKWIFAHTKEAKETYPIPSAFAAFKKVLGVTMKD